MSPIFWLAVHRSAFFVNILVSIAQDVDTPVESDARDRGPDQQIRPIGTCQHDGDTRQYDAAVRDEIVDAERGRRTQIDILVLELLQQVERQQVHDTRNSSHHHHDNANGFGALNKAASGIDYHAAGENQQHDAGESRRRSLPYARAGQRQQAQDRPPRSQQEKSGASSINMGTDPDPRAAMRSNRGTRRS